MALSSNKTLTVYRSRKTILELFKFMKYDVDDYTDFSINEIDAMYESSQLDMLISNKEDKKAYIKYYLTSKQLRPETLNDMIEDLFQIEEVLKKSDTLVIIVNDEPNDTIINRVKYLYDKEGIFVVIHNIRRLQFNILNHILVPNIQILKDSEIAELKVKFNLKNEMQLPEISRFDPQALAVAMRPGQICKLTRKSSTSLFYNYYRVCV
jgi:DNA-directed RNA polymerase subunit H (RpoH/RPB5)